MGGAQGRQGPSSAALLIEQAAAARAIGDVDGMRTALIEACRAAQSAGDVDAMATAALALPSGQRFGIHPGVIPGLLHEAYSRVSAPRTRARLAAALTRAWVYGGDAGRATSFAIDAAALAAQTGQPEIVADALDAALLASWGPDDLRARLELSSQLLDVTAHLTDADLRLSAHLWRLTTAWECLDVVAVQRQLRALELLAEETGSDRVAFFASARRAMAMLAIGDLSAADQQIDRTAALAGSAGEPDVQAVQHSLVAERARQAGDVDVLSREAAAFETYGVTEGVHAVQAEAAVLWLRAGHPDRAAQIVRQLAGDELDQVRRDVDFLLTVTSLIRVAAELHLRDLLPSGIALLEPYAGRAVLNAGAVVFHGVVDDYVHRAHQALGTPDAPRWGDSARTCYRRIGAVPWERALQAGGSTVLTVPTAVVHLHPHTDGIWTVGRAGATAALTEHKGLRYLRMLLARPGVDVAALAMSDADAGHPGGGVVPADAGEVIDAAAVTAYRQRLADIDDDLAEADAWADVGHHDRLVIEREALLDQVRSAAALAGRMRRSGSTSERARIAVRKAIASAIDHVGTHDPSLARLLQDTVHTGTHCRYDPDPSRPVTWVLEQPTARDPRVAPTEGV